MNYGLCNLSIVPLRAVASDTSEMVSQVLYGETFKVLESRKKWSRIRLSFDKYEGWIDNKQFLIITDEDFKELENNSDKVSSDLVDVITTSKNELLSICLGSNINAVSFLDHLYEGNSIHGVQSKSNIIGGFIPLLYHFILQHAMFKCA